MMTRSMNRLIASAAIFAATTTNAGESTPGQVYVFDHVDLIPMTSEAVLDNRTVVVKAGKVEQICTTEANCAPHAATRIDGRGRFLMPGLTDMHAHISSIIHRRGHRTQDQQLRQYLIFGVTTLRDPAGGPRNLETRAAIESGQRIGPRIFTAWIPMDGDPKLHPVTTSFATPSQAAEFVRRTAAEGYDMVKIYSTLSKEVFDTIMSTARDEEIVVSGHLPMPVDFEHALKSGMRSVEHLSGFDIACAQGEYDYEPTMLHVYQGWANCTPDEITALAELTAKYGVWNDPTLIVMEELNTDYQRYAEINAASAVYHPAAYEVTWDYLYNIFPAFSRAGIQGTRSTRLAIVKALSDAGAPLLIGTDTMATGYNVHQELALFVEAGLTPYQALLAATVEPARYFNKEGEFGTIVPGASADFVLLDANPLDDIANAKEIAGVMVRGAWFPRERLNEMQEELFREYAADRAIGETH